MHGSGSEDEPCEYGSTRAAITASNGCKQWLESDVANSVISVKCRLRSFIHLLLSKAIRKGKERYEYAAAAGRAACERERAGAAASFPSFSIPPTVSPSDIYMSSIGAERVMQTASGET